MPRRKNVTAKASRSVATRRSTRQAAAHEPSEDDVPEVFQDLLIEAYKNNPEDFAPSPRATKRRRVDDDHDEQPQPVQHPEPSAKSSPPSPAPKSESPASQSAPGHAQQVVFNNDFSDEDESDVSFEDVNISRAATPVSDEDDEQVKPKTLTIDLSSTSKAAQTRQPARRQTKPLTKIERNHRLNVHKWHFLCLMLHLQTINGWCNNEVVQRTLKPLVSRKISNRLHLPESRTQAERKFSFQEAIEQICHIWKLTFKITTQGMRKAQWRDQLDMASELENSPDPIDLEDFQDAAKRCSGSRDLGAQLFCALLRSLAVDARLVCSLQVLPFARAAATTGTTPQKVAPTYINAGVQDFGTSSMSSRVIKKRIIDSPFPIWWVEVFSPSISAWIPLDPVVRNTINKPRTGFEPPASDSLNAMSYVIAFEEDGYAKDVTCRYTSYYNAKTRRSRVEVAKGGSDWLLPVMQHFATPNPDRHDREAIEDAELRRRVAQEGMPKNVQDLKDHPVYVLERHLRQNEVIEPKRECGKFSVGSGKNARLENVYRRENVHSCRSSEGWYRRGRDIQPGQQPLKRAVPRTKRAASLRLDDHDDENAEDEDNSVPLYAEFQTDLYIPPPVVDGRIPRNGFGNLDVYVSSMIPAGGVHVRHTLARQASGLLKIDAADAVTGFIFKGRQGTAVVDGVVVDERYTAAMLTTISGLEDQLENDINTQRSAIISNVWKKMHTVLKVRQRIEDEYGGKAGIDTGSKPEDEREDDDDDSTYEDDSDRGGFMPDVIGEATKKSRAEEAENLKRLKDRAPIVLPALTVKQRPVLVRSPHKLVRQGTAKRLPDDDGEDLFGDMDETEPGGFLPEEEAPEAGGFIIENRHTKDPLNNDSANDAHNEKEGGGFVPEHDTAGGFVPDDDDGTTGGGFIPEHVPDNQTGSDGGGGFLPEDDTEAGGFVPDSTPPKKPTNVYPVSTNSTSVAAPPISEDPNKPPISSTQSTNSTIATATTSGAGKNRRKRRGTPPATVQTTRSIDGTDENNRRPADGEDGNSEDDDHDDNSLPSHDPDEDDMEMQWVEDAFED